jgi:hypothetical protein
MGVCQVQLKNIVLAKLREHTCLWLIPLYSFSLRLRVCLSRIWTGSWLNRQIADGSCMLLLTIVSGKA